MSETLVDYAAERAVLSGIFLYGEAAYDDVSDVIGQPTVFVDETNQALYKCFEYLIEKRELKELDKSSVMSAANELGYGFMFENPDELSHVKAIMNSQVKPDNVRHWAAQIRKLQIARLLKVQLSSAMVDIDKITGNESIDQILGMAENAVFDFGQLINQSNDTDPTLLGDGIYEYYKHLAANPVEQVGVSTGFKYYDQYIGGGFRRKTVSLLGARTGVGKSLISDNIALHVSSVLGIPVLYLDTEMSKEDHWHRVGANAADIIIPRLETGKFGSDADEKRRLKKAIAQIQDAKFWYQNISGRPVEETISIMRRWLKQRVGYDKNGRMNDCLIIYDYIKMMSAEGITAALQEYQTLGFMMTGLHNFAVKYDVPIFALTQLNKDGIDKETTGVVAGSDRITWLATNLAVYKPKSDEEVEADGGLKNGTHKLVVIKSRHGGGTPHGDWLNLKMTGDKARIVEGETHINLKKKLASAVDVDELPPPSEFNDTDSIPLPDSP